MGLEKTFPLISNPAYTPPCVFPDSAVRLACRHRWTGTRPSCPTGTCKAVLYSICKLQRSSFLAGDFVTNAAFGCQYYAAADHHRPMTNTRLYCLVTEAWVCMSTTCPQSLHKSVSRNLFHGGCFLPFLPSLVPAFSSFLPLSSAVLFAAKWLAEIQLWIVGECCTVSAPSSEFWSELLPQNCILGVCRIAGNAPDSDGCRCCFLSVEHHLKTEANLFFPVISVKCCFVGAFTPKTPCSYGRGERIVGS